MKIDRDNVSDEIPTSSMADIAFLLIIYFMVTTTFTATRGLDFQLPKDDDNPPVIEKEESVLIEILPSGDLQVDGRPMFVEEIVPYLKPKLERNPEKPVIIRPDPVAPYGFMVEVLDELRRCSPSGYEDAKLSETERICPLDRRLDGEIRISIPTQREIESFWY